MICKYAMLLSFSLTAVDAKTLVDMEFGPERSTITVNGRTRS